MLERFRQFATERHLFPDGGEVLLAVSGGRDSVVLAHLLHRSGIPFAMAHCNFNLRLGECDRDQRFVQQLAEHLGTRLFTTSFDTSAFARNNGISVEEAARNLRYEWFASICRTEGFACLATAHHRDDSVETFFLNLFRGTGIAGLHGISPDSTFAFNGYTMRVVRPMLCFSRADIDAYVATQGVDYVDDSTNATLEPRRNRIRLQLMPLLRELYPSVDATMEANIVRLSDAGKVFSDHVDYMRRKLVHPYTSAIATLPMPMEAVSVADIANLDPKRTLLFEMLRPYGFNAAVVDDIISGIAAHRTGLLFESHTHEAELHRGSLLLAPRRQQREPSLAFSTLVVSDVADYRRLESDKKGVVERFDALSVSAPLSVRPWRDGDRFRPLGMQGTRLVSDFLKDCGLSIIERRHVWLLVDAADRVVWVVGLRLDDRFRITPSTSTAMRVECVAP